VQSDERAPKKPWITLERTGCFGTCPIFTIRVFADGRVEWFGKKFVGEVGRKQRKMELPKLERLREAVAGSNIGKLAPDCCNCWEMTDQPWTHLEIASDKETSLVNHYHGCSKAPESLTRLEQEIISNTGVVKWIGSGSRRREDFRSELSF